jgi:hypothetical protein
MLLSNTDPGDDYIRYVSKPRLTASNSALTIFFCQTHSIHKAVLDGEPLLEQFLEIQHFAVGKMKEMEYGGVCGIRVRCRDFFNPPQQLTPAPFLAGKAPKSEPVRKYRTPAASTSTAITPVTPPSTSPSRQSNPLVVGFGRIFIEQPKEETPDQRRPLSFRLEQEAQEDGVYSSSVWRGIVHRQDGTAGEDEVVSTPSETGEQAYGAPVSRCVRSYSSFTLVLFVFCFIPLHSHQ